MISVQDYRIAIGCFLGKAQVSFFVSKKQEVLNKARRKQNNSKFKSTRGGIDTSLSKPRVCEWRWKTITMSLICISVMLALVLRLINDGDIQSNPGPIYVIEKAMSHITRVISGLVIQRVFNVHVILCILFAGHKLKKCIHGIHQI